MIPARTAVRPWDEQLPGAYEPTAVSPRVRRGPGPLAHALAAWAIQPKLRIDEPGDAFEQEADARAEQVMSSPPASGTADSCCSGCASGTGCSDSVQRLATAVGSPSRGTVLSPEAESRIRSGTPPGQPLPGPARAFFEARLNHDLGHVRLHSDPDSARFSDGLQAHAFTYGSHIWLGSGQRPEPSRVLAHELTHVLQQTGGRGATPEVQRDAAAFDPSKTGIWEFLGGHREWKAYLATVGAAPGAANALAKDIAATNAVPQTDDEHDALEERVRTLIRLKAVALVGQHRDELEKRKAEFQAMLTGPPATSTAGDDQARSRMADTANAMRSAARMVMRLNDEKSMLKDLRTDISNAVRVNAGADTIEDEYQTLWNDAQPDSSPEIMHRMLVYRAWMDGKSFWGAKKSVLLEARNELSGIRRRQIDGIDVALTVVYDAFPTLADLSASEVLTGTEPGRSGRNMLLGAGLMTLSLTGTNTLTGVLGTYLMDDALKGSVPPDDERLIVRIGESFDRLLERTDDAIVKVGSADINEFDLPGAVAAARAALPMPLQAEVDRLVREHEARKFAWEMVLALGLAVLTGLTGGAAAIGATAWAAAGGLAIGGIGVAQLGSQLGDMLDRRTLALASTSPDQTLLGVSAPSNFEWAMFGVSAVLTAVDLAAVTREIAALKPRFNEEPHLPRARAEPLPPGAPEAASAPRAAGAPEAGSAPRAAGAPEAAGAPGAPHPGTTAADVAAGPGIVRTQDAAEMRILEAGRGETPPSLEQLDAELSLVEETPPARLKGDPEYAEEVALPNEHTWKRRPDGSWCRFSKSNVCVLPRAKRASALVRERATTEADLDAFVRRTQPDLRNPPPGMVVQDDAAMWELYIEYYNERITSTRNDFRSAGATERELPLDFDKFRQRYTDNPELIAALRGRLAQSATGRLIEDITSGKAAGNLGLSKVEDPIPEEMLYPDFVWRGQSGYTAVSSKSRDFRGMALEDIRKQVIEDIDEALRKYYGVRYVRRRGIPQFGSAIDIDEVILNYDPRYITDSTREFIKNAVPEYGREGIQVGFFDFKPE
jgi:Domain of unknown function (DUF4157)